MAEPGSGKRWLKYGCGGCLAALLLGAVGTGILFGVVFVGGQPGAIEEEVLTPEVPAAPRPDAETAEPGRPSICRTTEPEG